jgi:hypothetical protein
MALANTLAYYDMAKIIALRSFIVQAPGVWFFTFKKYNGTNLLNLSFSYP